ncbi:MAG: 4'-phosphopantetheinyl transferase superfamily protein [Rhodospirillaceae bacterium]|jgi:hypothetical protein|nr:4'-phosphopantetheinyl transferase superfamily protein [Rhodospirillaceae bacterium]MBT5523061.1 4'-phosphopantetheinyl transferase superfamily protein [Rhodospirillaceae bacterium]MBT6588463.1 4'-phosphopantetheinyl transferase superfamily protein [Rhodospirillaceae bacterium]MBT7286729.1 4'-phosphopantetheinyl transferase superfamily protein [Rhodospirillaceae bacterium]
MLVATHFAIGSDGPAPLLGRFNTRDDHDYAGRYRRGHRRCQSLIAVALLRYLISSFCPQIDAKERVLRTKKGRPYLAGDGADMRIDISLSHSRNRVAAAISTVGPVGIDIEYLKPRRDFHAMAQQVSDLTKRQAVLVDSAESFYRLWTMGESLLKATCSRDVGWLGPKVLPDLLGDRFCAIEHQGTSMSIGSRNIGSYMLGLTVIPTQQAPRAARLDNWPDAQMDAYNISVYPIVLW